MKPLRRHGQRPLLYTALVLTLSCAASQADTVWWEGGFTAPTMDWGTGSNWSTTAAGDGSAGAAPQSTDDLIFNTTGITGNRTITLGADRTIRSLTFNSAGGVTFLSGSSSAARYLYIGAGGITMNTGAGAVVFGTGASTGVPVRLNSSQTWTNNSSSTLSVLNTLAGSSETPITLTIDGSGTTAISNAVSNSTGSTLGIVKNGSGLLDLTAAGSNGNFSGGVTLNSGVIAMNADRLGVSALAFNGGTLRTNGTFSATRATVLGGTATYEVQGDTTFTENGAISGSGSLVKAGTGTLALGGTNTYSGQTAVNAGTLLLNSRSSLYNAQTGSWTGSNIQVASGATLALAIDDATSTTLFTSSDITTLLAGSALNTGSYLGLSATTSTATFSGNITNANGGTNVIGFNKVGANTVVLSGTNTYTGRTIINSGTLQFGTRASLYNATTSRWNADNIQVASGATLGITVGGTGGFTTTDIGTIIGSNTLVSGSRLGLNMAANTSVSTALADANGGTASIGILKNGSANLTLAGTTANTFSGPLTVAGGVLLMAKTAGVNAAGGNVIVTGGELRWTNSNQIADTATLSSTGGLMSMLGQNETLAAVTIAGGGLTTGAGSLVVTGTMTLGVGGGSPGTSLTISTSATTSGSVDVQTLAVVGTSNGGGNILIGGSDANKVATLTVGSGGMSMTGQYVQFNRPGSTTGKGGQIVLNGDFTGTGTNGFAHGPANGNNTPSGINLGGVSARKFTINSGTTTIGVRVLNGGLEKAGTGTLVLSGTGNDYAGPTAVSAGTLLINSSTAGGNVTVASGATLGGIGTVGGATTISGTHAAGSAGIGTQRFSAGLTYESGSTFSWDLGSLTTTGAGTSFDSVVVTGALAVNNAKFQINLTNLNLNNAFWQTDKSWNVFSATSGTGNFYEFVLYDTAASTTAPVDYSDYGSFSFNAATGSLNWTAVPEPTNALAGLLVAAGLMRRRRSGVRA